MELRAPHGYAAFAAADLFDAERGQPAHDLAAYAAARDLDHVVGEVSSALAGVLPSWPDHVFGVARGALAGGRYGLIEHELYEVPVGSDGHLDMPGALHGERRVGGRSLAAFLGVVPEDPGDGAFGGHAVWVPATKVAVRVPEAALLPGFVVRTASHLPVLTSPRLDAVGAPGYRMAESAWVSDRLRGSLLAGAPASVLASLDEPFVEVEVSHAALALTVNGYRHDHEVLDGLVVAAVALADALSTVHGEWWIEAPFAAPLPPPDPARRPTGFPRGGPDVERDLRRAAGALDMEAEEPSDLHRLLPRIPVPGVAVGALRGSLPGGVGVGRLSWHAQGGGTEGRWRGAMSVPVSPGTPRLPPGGVGHRPTGMQVEVVDGTAFVWEQGTPGSRIDALGLRERAVEAFCALSLAGAHPS